MPEHAEDMVYLVHVKVGFSLFYFADDGKRYTGTFSELCLCQVYFLPALLYKGCQSFHYMCSDIKNRNPTQLYAF